MSIKGTVMTENNNQPYSSALNEIDNAISKLEMSLSQKVVKFDSLKTSVESSIRKIDALLAAIKEGEK